MKKREVPEPKRFVADTTKEFHAEIRKYCFDKGVNLKDFVIDAIKEKYRRDTVGCK